MSLLSSIGKTLYKGATTKAGAGLIIGGAAVAGLAKNAAPAARDAAMDVAFGDPNADEAFLGRKLTPGAVFDAAVPGSHTGRNTIGAMGAGAMLGGVVGGMAKGFKGGALGAAFGATAGLAGSAAMGIGYINRNERFINESPYVGTRRLNRDMTYGGKIYGQQRNSSLETAQELNADGNIVLGMHNLRRGG
jgi:hypothetical protein